MREARQVLAIDEQRATLEFLRSVLPLVEGERFEITRALSAEEGLLALRRQPYELLITGLRLPGVDGLTLCQWAKRLRPEMGVILTTERPLDELADQAAVAGVDHLLQKPLKADEFLAAVQASLVGAPHATAPKSRAYAADEPVKHSGGVLLRLEALGEETGAVQVVLATVSGQILNVTGDKLLRGLPRLITETAVCVGRTLDLAAKLNEGEPKAIQYLEGSRIDVYWANVGWEHFVAILCDAQLRRGRLGALLLFTRRAVDDLRSSLVAAPAATGAPEPERAAPASETKVVEDAASKENAPPAAPSAEKPPETSVAQAREDANGETAPEPPGQTGAATDPVDEQSRTAEELALDAFWDEALAAYDGTEGFGSGISLKEAKARGLIAEDFDPDRLLGKDES